MYDDSAKNPPSLTGVEVLRPAIELLESQKWYQKFSNTATTAVGGLTMGVFFAASIGFDLPREAMGWGFMVIGVGTALGVLKTPNGMTESLLQKMLAQYLKSEKAD